jgi:hypothetical protein
MTTFLIFVMALIICVALVAWGLGMVVLRLAPMGVMLRRRRYAWEDVERLKDRVDKFDDRVKILEAELVKLKEEQVNEVLAMQRRR